MKSNKFTTCSSKASVILLRCSCFGCSLFSFIDSYYFVIVLKSSYPKQIITHNILEQSWKMFSRKAREPSLFLSRLCLAPYHGCMHHGAANKLHRVATPLPLSLSCQVEPLKHPPSLPPHLHPSIHLSIPLSPIRPVSWHAVCSPECPLPPPPFSAISVAHQPRTSDLPPLHYYPSFYPSILPFLRLILQPPTQQYSPGRHQAQDFSCTIHSNFQNLLAFLLCLYWNMFKICGYLIILC